MSTAREVTVWCDVEGCPEWGPVDQYATTAAEARRMARSDGFVRRNGRDLCPNHAEPGFAPRLA
jgi:hypothetical protein